MEIITALIVDDEHYGRESLKNLLNIYCPEVNVLAVAESAAQAKKFVIQHSPDVVFLDINMPVLNGFDFLNSVDSCKFMVVFVSAHDEYGIKAVKAHAVDYLLKPVNINELLNCVKNLVANKGKKSTGNIDECSQKILLPQSHGFEVFEIDNIMRFEADDCYTNIFTEDGKQIVVTKILKDFVSILQHKHFFRIHRSCIINLKYIKEFSHIDGGYVIMSDGSKLEVSRRRVPDFIQQYKKYSKIN